MFGYPNGRYLTIVVKGGYEESETLWLPANGVSELRVDRVAGRLIAVFDGIPFFATAGDFNYGSQEAVTLRFAGAFENAPLSVDYVSVNAVPEMSTAISFLVALSSIISLLKRFSART